MAMALSKELKEEFFECSICLETFTHPKVLNCFHSFCEECLKGLLEKRNNKGKCIECPICRKPTELGDNGVSGLQPNFLINSLQDAIGKIGSAPVSCEFCDTGATYKCIQCADNLCDTHSTMHTFSKQTRNHNVAPLADIKAGKYHEEIQAAQQVECGSHPGKCIELYCTQCNVPVCLMCKVTLHESHSCVTLDKACINKKNTINDKMAETTKFKTVLQSYIDNLDDNFKTLTTQKDLLLTDISQQGDAFREQISNQERALKEELLNMFQQENKEYETVKDDGSSTLACIESSIEFATTLTKCGRDVDIMMFEKQLTENLEQMNKLYSTKNDINTGGMNDHIIKCPHCQKKCCKASTYGSIFSNSFLSCFSCKRKWKYLTWLWECSCGHTQASHTISQRCPDDCAWCPQNVQSIWPEEYSTHTTQEHKPNNQKKSGINITLEKYNLTFEGQNAFASLTSTKKQFSFKEDE